MNISKSDSGKQRAKQTSADLLHPDSTLADLLLHVDKTAGSTEAMLHSIATRICEFLKSAPDAVSIARIEEVKEDYLQHLKTSKYAPASRKSYRNYLNILLKRATDAGWNPPQLVMTEEWKAVSKFLPRASTRKIVEFAVRTGTRVADFCEEDLSAWQLDRAKKGVAIATAQQECSRFRSALAKAPDTIRPPHIRSLVNRYGVALSAMTPELRKEVEDLVAWKTSDLQFDRPAGAQIRPISARLLTDFISRLVGFGQNVQRRKPFYSLTEVVNVQLVQDYARWAKNERNIKGQSISTGLGMVFAALRHNPKYSTLDLSWFETLLEQILPEDQSLIEERKERKYIPYAVADQIPSSIRAARKFMPATKVKAIAHSVQDELLMQWLIILPWRQKNIRSCRISGDRPNLFKGPVRAFSSTTKPQWIIDNEKVAPGSSYWQFRFDPHETKTKNSVLAFLPYDLISLLESFLGEHRRHLLINGRDPGCLFVNHAGKMINGTQMTNRVRKLALKHAGRPLTPHLYRDIVAFEWLSNHPEDYLTVSKLLWHRNINTTLRIYGKRFDESTGVARMDDWRTGRNAAGCRIT